MCHPILGGEDSKKQGLDGSHRSCLLAAIAVTRQSILDLMASSPCQRICSRCHFKEDHEAMMSGVPACPTCGASLEDNIGVYITMWVGSLVRRNHKSGRGDLVHPVSTNFTVLAEHLPSPH